MGFRERNIPAVEPTIVARQQKTKTANVLRALLPMIYAFVHQMWLREAGFVAVSTQKA